MGHHVAENRYDVYTLPYTTQIFDKRRVGGPEFRVGGSQRSVWRRCVHVGFYRVVPMGDAVRVWVDGPITREDPEGGGGLELVMRVKVRGSDGVTFWVRALVDTGSQANLVRGDIAGKLLVPSRCPVRLVQANGDPVKRGAKEADLRVTFRKKVQPNDDEELVWRGTVLFHEAEMRMK